MQWKEFSAGLRPFSAPELARIQKAFEFGEAAHQGQKRLSGEPYFTHPTAVARKVSDWGADTDTVIAALLHDTVEDTAIKRPDIVKNFGENVALLIDGMTKISTKDLGDRPNLDIKTETLRKIFTAMEQDIRIMVIKLADRLHNMQTIISFPPEKQREYAQQTHEIYVKIADRLSMFSLRMELESLCIQILEPELFRKLDRLRLLNQKRGADLLPKLEKNIRGATKTSIQTIHFEDKTWQKLRTQLDAGHSTTGISDLVLTIVVKDPGACYQILGVLHQLWQREHLSFQDFINSPMINGYEGLHTTVILEDGTRIRCKIRSEQMQRYSDYGVTTVCFSEGLKQDLPWTKRIRPLAQATIDRSSEFWHSLQNDILSDSIVVHAVDDQALLLPAGATVLDGIFYCYSEDALRLERALVNGKEMPLGNPLPDGVSLSLEIGSHVTAKREWLNWVKTGLAIAAIKQQLASQNQRSKTEIGRNLLQEFMTKKRAGFLEEYSPESFRPQVTQLGFRQIKEVYVAIAEGRLEPEDAYRALFESNAAERQPAVSAVNICMLGQTDGHALLAAALRVMQSHNLTPSSIKLRARGQATCIALNTMLQLSEWRKVAADLQALAGVTEVSITHRQSNLRFVFGVVLLILLWGADPAVAHHLLGKYHMSPWDLTLVRFWSLTALASVFLLWQRRIRRSLLQVQLPLLSRSLWLSVLLLLSISVTSYLALRTTSAVHYTIPMTAAGILLTSIVNWHRRWVVFLSWFLLTAGVAWLIYASPDWPIRDSIYTLLAVASFSAFSIVSEQYKRRENVQARVGQYFFYLSLFSAVLSTPLVLFTDITSLSWTALAAMAGFCVIFAGLPYYIYYYLLSHEQIDYVLRYSFLIIFASFASQWLLDDAIVWKAALPAAIFVITAACLPLIAAKFNQGLNPAKAVS